MRFTGVKQVDCLSRLTSQFTTKLTSLLLAAVVVCPALACNRSRKSNLVAWDEISSREKFDPLDRGRRLAAIWCPRFIVEGQRISRQDHQGQAISYKHRTEYQQIKDNYTKTIEIIFGYFPELADLIGRTNITIIAVDDIRKEVEHFVRDHLKRKINPLVSGVESWDRVKACTIPAMKGNERVFFIFVAKDIFRQPGDALAAVLHEFCHIEHMELKGGLDSNKRAHIETEIAIYLRTLEMLQNILRVSLNTGNIELAKMVRRHIANVHALVIEYQAQQERAQEGRGR